MLGASDPGSGGGSVAPRIGPRSGNSRIGDCRGAVLSCWAGARGVPRASAASPAATKCFQRLTSNTRGDPRIGAVRLRT